jgi:tRNA(Ile)-lysidine synthase
VNESERRGAQTCAALAGPALDRRLDRRAQAPLIVAFSGGGDSLALLIAAKAWADGAGRRLIAVTVDHGLQAAGAAWAAWCEARCIRLKVEHRTLAWMGEKPATGLAAAARAARHALMARAAREAGAGVILMGHTADDRLEARLMRSRGGSVPEPREWAPSPLWPGGRGHFILRPLIGTRRAAIREALTVAGETWIEDPANSDPRQPRSRARATIAGGRAAAPPGASLGAGLLRHVVEGPGGDLTIARAGLAPAPVGEVRALIGAALLCASGTDRPPRGERLDRLLGRLAKEDRFVATLAGARVEADGEAVRIVREAGDPRRAVGAFTPLRAGACVVWDGRFEIKARSSGPAIGSLRGLMARLDGPQRDALKTVPARARPGLPAVIDEAGRVTCPTLVADHRLSVRSLVSPRLAAALGAVNCEAAMGRMAKTLATT